MKSKNAKVFKTAIIICVIFALLIGGVFAFKKVKDASKVVYAFPVSMMDVGFMEDPTSMEGIVYEADSQVIQPASTQIVTEVYVEVGQEVKAGDKLLSYDMTAQSLTLRLKELILEKSKHDLAVAGDELVVLQNTVPIPEVMPVVPDPEPEPEKEEYPAPGTPAKEGDAWNALTAESVNEYTVISMDTNPQPDIEGAETNPYTYLVTEDAKIYGSFLNALREKSGAYASIEIRAGNDIDGELIAKWLISTSSIEFQEEENRFWFVRTHKSVDDVSTTEPEPEPEPEPEIPVQPEGPTAAELAEAITLKRQEIRELDLGVRRAELDLVSMQNEMKDGIVYAKRDGVVTVVSDPQNPPNDGSPFLRVDAGAGVYIQGHVSELLLETVKVGQPIVATSWSDGSVYMGEIYSIDDYPIEGQYYAPGNPNVSFYGFLAYFEEAEGINPNEYLNLNIEQTFNMDSIFLEKAFVRNDAKGNYVMKEVNGLLEKQYVDCGKIYYGQIIEITGGLSYDDYIAFPYGDGSREGVKVEKSDDMEELWL